MIKVNEELKILSNKLREIFSNIYEKLKDEKISSKNLDSEVLAILKNREFTS